MSPYPTVVMVTTAHQNEAGIDLKNEFSFPASAKYTTDEKSTTPKINNMASLLSFFFVIFFFFFNFEK